MHDLKINIILAFLRAKSLIMPSRLEFASIFFSVDKIANSFNLSCDILKWRYNLINFNFEKLRYAKVTVTGIVNNFL